MPNKKKRSAVATEVSAHGRIDGVLTQFPTIVPNSTEEEIAHIVSGGLSDRKNPLTKRIYIKAEQFAKKRIDAGKSPFKEFVGPHPITGPEHGVRIGGVPKGRGWKGFIEVPENSPLLQEEGEARKHLRRSMLTRQRLGGNNYKKGGNNYKKGGAVKKKRSKKSIDGIAQRGKTRGTMR